jgi:putative redox protein
MADVANDEILEFSDSDFQWHAVGELIEGFAVRVTMDTSEDEKGSGPWSMVVEEPTFSGGAGTGPSPVNLALGSLAACTVVTVAGVARRRGMDLQSIRVEIDANKVLRDKRQAEDYAAEGRTTARRQAQKRLVVTGNLSEEDLTILQRAAHACPVGRLFRDGWLLFHESVEHRPPGDGAALTGTVSA